MSSKEIEGMEPQEPSSGTTTEDFLNKGGIDSASGGGGDDEPDGNEEGDGPDDELSGEQNDAAGDEQSATDDAEQTDADDSPADDEGSDASVSADQPGIVELEDGTLRRRMTVYLDPDDGKKVKVLAALENRKISDVLAEAVEEYLERQELPEL
jgi:hypothetical protein